MPILYLIIAFILNSAGNVVFKIAATRGIILQGDFLSIIWRNYLVILGFLLYAVNACFYVLALRTLPLSIAYPIMLVMSLIIVNIISIFLLHESLNNMQLIGYALLILGVVVIFYFQK
jgi:multidrug transporter EmrE-like cation transporter